MIPILYDSNEVSFTSNGLGRLRSCIEAKVVEERNGVYELDFSYPVDGENYELIQLGRIIGVTHEDSADIQPFDIISCSRPINGIVTFHCTHISYRQSKMVTYGSSVSTLTGAFQIFEQVFYPEKPLGYTSSGNPFVYQTDKTGTIYIPAFDGTPRSIRSLLGGVEGSILDTFGGEYEWDKWNVILHAARGSVKDFTIRYGVNLTDFQDDTDYSESFNTCVPFWKDSSSGVTVIGSEINTEQSTVGVGDRCVPLDLSDKFENQPTVADLESMASSVMTANRPYLPSQNIKVDFIRLQDEAGFDQFDSLLQCKLCDSIKVIFPHYGMSAYFKIVKTVWNVLKDRYDSMELGDLSATLSEALGISNGLNSGGSGGGGVSVLDFYPVGSYYETSDTAFNPNVTWGGTWALETEGQVHISSGANYSVAGALTNTTDGGSKDAVVVSHTHKVSSGWQSASGQPDRITFGGVNGGYNNTGYGGVQFIESVGVDGTNKNLQPYIIVKRWHRTA